ncbi:hypothetical protein VKT23_003072 [Stygiomarasmius scandens]|uniref:Uncharacterized protein n=1 Tax=Marasmiellus scandens TaxID=2682957 RepID=A0ABR1JXK2_9AGAR
MLALEKDNVIRMNLQLQMELQKTTNDRNFLLHVLDRFRRQGFSSKCSDSDSASELRPVEQTKREKNQQHPNHISSSNISQRIGTDTGDLEAENARLKSQLEATNAALKEQNERHQAQIADIKAESSASTSRLKDELEMAIRRERDVKGMLKTKTAEYIKSSEEYRRMRTELKRAEEKRRYLEKVVADYKAYTHKIKSFYKGKLTPTQASLTPP